jgi:hypothetical protein
MSDTNRPDNLPPSPSEAPPSVDDLALAERMLAALRSGSDVRRRKVRRVRAAVRALAYENPLKLHVALDRVAGELTQD